MMNLDRLHRALDHVERAGSSEAGRLDELAWLRVAQDELAQVVDDRVGRLRAAHGASWAEIGDALGITKQGAQQRFGA